MHQSFADGTVAESDRRGRELERLSISARTQLMTFARVHWLRDRGSPRGEAQLWRLWESDWTAIRRTAVRQLPAWCRDGTAAAPPVEGHRLAITSLRQEAISESLGSASAASSSARPAVALQSTLESSVPVIPSPAMAIHRSIVELPAVAMATQAPTRLAKTSMLEDEAMLDTLELVSNASRGLLN